MTPNPPPWLVTHISHGTLGDRACPLRGTQRPGQAARHAPQPPTPLLLTCRAGYPQPGCTPLPQHSLPPTPSPSSTARHTWELGIFWEGDAADSPSWGRGSGGPSSQGSTPCGLVTGSHKPSSRWLILVKPVVKMCPSRVKMARTGLSPSWGANLSWGEGETVSTGHGKGENGGGPDLSPKTAVESIPWCSPGTHAAREHPRHPGRSWLG